MKASKQLLGMIMLAFGSASNWSYAEAAMQAKPADIEEVIRKYELPRSFPKAALDEANKIAADRSDTGAPARTDLRHRKIFTIDGETAKDLDDAVSIEALANDNLRLGVHIADVGFYVKEGSALDKEAYQRGCSIYLLDRVIPMLPEKLSNDLCSLAPATDKLTLTCDMEINPFTGKIVRYNIYPSIINSRARMTYTEVNQVLASSSLPSSLTEKYRDFAGDLQLMGQLAKILHQKRAERGSLDFNPKAQKAAEGLIEEFMLAANETVAQHFSSLNAPFIYRVHDRPDLAKLSKLAKEIKPYGYVLDPGADTLELKREMQQILRDSAEVPEHSWIQQSMLLTMKKARYSAEAGNHFGLGTNFYSHFTSPIRRYPDLAIHRIIRELLVNPEMTPSRYTALKCFTAQAAEQSSQREYIASKAERASKKYRQKSEEESVTVVSLRAG